jgi:hypothetical protein
VCIRLGCGKGGITVCVRLGCGKGGIETRLMTTYQQFNRNEKMNES